MKQKLQILAILIFTGLCSCQRSQLLKSSNNTSTSELIVPIGFKWENSRTVHFTLSITDTRFGTAKNRILIYDGDPGAGGNLILNGFATIRTPYAGNTYLSNLITTVYIVKTAVNNVSSTSLVHVGNSNVTINMGI